MDATTFSVRSKGATAKEAYEAKFKREAQERPADWIIIPEVRGKHELKRVPRNGDNKCRSS